ncbi:MAG: T9SS type A sorting domain-containing protein [Ignavibacteriaceae bacterium]|nr:T9SS type A sorting domain-containing protein [Ignavibacteriaceae bacterium]
MKNIFLSLLFSLGIFFSANAQWSAVNTSFGKSIAALLKAGNSFVAATDSNGVYFSDGSDNNWVQRNSGISFLRTISLAYNGSTIAVGTRGGGVYLTSNNGSAWTQASLTNMAVPHIYALTYLAGNLLAGSGGGGVYHSTNNGGAWTNQPVSTSLANSFYVSPSGNYAYLCIGSRIHKSNADGTVWTQIGSANATLKTAAEILAGGGVSYLFAGTADGVYLSSNGGTSWSSRNSGLTYRDVNKFAVYGSNLFAATSGGVFRTTNNGTSWESVSTGMPGVPVVTDLLIDGGNIYAATTSGIIYKRALSEVVTSVEKSDVRTEIKMDLKQNSPNPFSQTTRIIYRIPDNTGVNPGKTGLAGRRVILSVCNLLGSEVARLVDEEQSPGLYEVSFSPRGLSNGVYFYRLQYGGQSETRKMTLVR